MIIWHAAVFAAYFVKGVAGFANTLIHAGVMAFYLDNAVITPVDSLLTAPATGVMLWKHRAGLDRRIWLPVALVSSAFLVPGALLLRNMDGRAVKLIFGAVVIALSLDMLRPAQPRRGNAGRGWEWALIVLSGILSGMFGVGALTAAAMGRMTKDSRAMKANLSAVFAVDNILRLIIYAFTGLLTDERLLQALALAPAMGAGLFLGIRCAGRLSERTVRLCIVCALALSGAMLIVTNL